MQKWFLLGKPTAAGSSMEFGAVAQVICGLFGGGGIILHSNGIEWTKMTTPGNIVAYNRVFGFDKNHVWIVGEQKILFYDGVQMKEYSISATDYALKGIWGSGPEDVWFSGFECQGITSCSQKNALLLHFDGRTFWRAPLPDDSSSGNAFNSLNGLWGRAKDDIWAIRASGWILHYDGKSWNTVMKPNWLYYTGIYDISGFASTNEIWISGVFLLHRQN